MTALFSLPRARRRLTLLLLGGLLATLLAPTGTARAINNADRIQERPTTWAPTYAEAQLVQDRPWGDVAYFMNWGGPASTANLGSAREKRNVFEVGYKDLPASNGCDRYSGGTSSGFPNGMKIQKDYTEDADDYVYALFDGDYLAKDQRDNPGKIYGLWGRCNKDRGHFQPGNPYFQVQLGRYAAYQCVCDTNADASLNYIPAENGLYVVPASRADDRVTRSVMFAPWLRNGSAETNEGVWYGSSARVRQFCDPNSNQGRCHFNVAPNGGSSNWLGQRFAVSSYVSRNNFGNYRQLGTGVNTGFQYEGAFRCPTGYNSGACRVRIWLKTERSNTWQYVTYSIPRDNLYYVVMQDNWRNYGEG